MKTTIKKMFALFVVAAALGSASMLKAQTFSFNVDINTSAVTSSPSGPFALDFQLNWGSGPSNTATLSNFVFTGGSATGSATSFGGGVSGDMGSTITFTADSGNAFNEIFQGFTAGTTDIKFNVTLSQNGSGAQPTGFSVAVLDNTDANVLTTNDPIDSVLSVSLSTANTVSDVSTFSTTSPSGIVTTASAVPEPSTWALFVCGGAAMLFTLRLRQRNA